MKGARKNGLKMMFVSKLSPTIFSVLSSSSKHWAPLHYIGPATSFSNLLPLQEKSSKSCDNQLAVPPLSTDGSKSQRSKLMFEDR